MFTKMKTMKKNIATFALMTALVFAGSFVKAQGFRQGPPPPGMPDSIRVMNMVDRMAYRLNLTDEQKQEITDLYAAHFKEVEAKRKEMMNERQQHREEMEKIRQDFQKQVKSQLTQEQQEEFDEFMNYRRPPRGRMWGQAGPGRQGCPMRPRCPMRQGRGQW